MCYSVRTLDKPMPGIDEKLRSSGLSPLGGVRSEDGENATDCDRSRLPTDGPHYKIGAPHSYDFVNLVWDHFRRLRRQRQEGEEVPTAGRIRPEPALETSKRLFVLEQRDDDALGRRMLPLSEPSADASGSGPDCCGMTLKDSQPVSFLPVLETEAREPEEHGRASARIPIEFAGTGNFIFARSRRARRVRPEEHRRGAGEVREVRVRQGLF